MTFCCNCGAQLPDGARFCGACGASVSQTPISDIPADPVPVQPISSAAPQPLVYVPPVYNNTHCDTPNPKSQAQKVPLFTKKRLGLLKRLRVLVLCLLLLVSSLCCTLIGILRTVTQPEIITGLITGIDLAEIPASLFYIDVPDDTSLLDVFHQELGYVDPALGAVSERDLENYVQDMILPYIADEINDVFSDVYTKNANAAITQKEVADLLEDSTGYLAKSADFDLTQEMQDGILDYLDGEAVFEMLDLENLQLTHEDLLNILYFATSYVTMAVFGAIALICIVLLAAITRCPIRTLGSTGTTLLIAGLIPTALSLMPTVAKTAWTGLFGGQEYLARLAAELLASGRIIPLAITGGALALLVLRGLLLSIRVRK